MTQENRSELFDSSTEIGIKMGGTARRAISFHLTRLATECAAVGDHTGYESATSMKHLVRSDDETLVLNEVQWANLYGFLYLTDNVVGEVDGKQSAGDLAEMVEDALPDRVSDNISTYRDQFEEVVGATEVLDDE